MLTTTTKSLIFISFILAFAVALQDGDQVAFKTHATPSSPQLQYLNAFVSDGSLHMAPSTDYTTLSGTWWKAHLLADGNWAFENLGNPHNSQYIYLDANTYTGAVALKSTTDYPFTGTHWSLQTLSDGTVALKTMSDHPDPNYVYLDVNVGAGGFIGMKSTTDYPFTGTHWEIVTLVAASNNSSTTVSQPASAAGTGIPATQSAVALQDGAQVAFWTHASHYNANYQFLNANTVSGSVGMSAGYDVKTNLGSRWIAHLLSDGSWAFQNLGSPANAQHIYLNVDTSTGSINLAANTQASGTHWALETLSDSFVALKNLGSFSNSNYLYLNANTYTGSVGMAANTDWPAASGTYWVIHTIIDPNDQGLVPTNTGAVVGSEAQQAMPPSP